MQIQDILSLMNQMKLADLCRLEYESGGEILRLERQVSQPADLTGQSGPAGKADVPPDERGGQDRQSGLSSAAVFGRNGSPNAAHEPDDNTAGWLVRSPVVGIYYASPTPDCEPFVQVGSIVEVGSTLCIIEAMKLMNEVNCNADGQVLEIFAVNGQRVEYNQPLMRIGDH